MYTETRLSLREKKNALTIPLEAVSRNGEDATVLAVNKQNVIEERHVRLGAEDETRVEVLSGLSEQDRVVVGSRTQFRSGETVQPKEVSTHAEQTEGQK
jgi:multidrug efflux pump subunit AcrA (membrane-fusion protein)